MADKTTILMVMDGFGINEREEGNAVKLANTPNINYLMENYPYVLGNASGLDVGLPAGQMGNSEVGHLNIGAGRIVYQELTRITKSIEDGDFFENKALLAAMNNCIKKESKLHLYGLLSDGGVHSHITHLYALLKMAKETGIENVFIHTFLDGRDTPPTSGESYLHELEEKTRELQVGKIATVMGRYYSMDRDKRWERVKLAYEAMVLGKGNFADSVPACIQSSYENDINDEFVVPTVIVTDNKPVAVIEDNDSVICFNFRPDRAREITRTFCDEGFKGFVRDKGFINPYYVCLTEYDITIENKYVAYHADNLTNTLGEHISKLGLKQLRLAETEKYAHVTFFFNGGIEEPFELEDRILIPSPKVATYDLKPEMSAIEVTDALVGKIFSKEYDLIIINYANPDMVGHTGILSAATKAVETIDRCVKRVYDAVIETKAQLFICADHGNCDQEINYDTGESFTAHTTNPVPFILVNFNKIYKLRDGGRLCDIAPTILQMMNIEPPPEMTGQSLIIK